MINLKELSILIVEDEYIVALYLQEILETIGVAQVEIASNESQANKALQNATFDVAFVDIKLKNGSDGIDIAANLKKQGQNNIIFASAHSEDEALEKALAVSTNGFMLKPFRAEDVKAMLFTCLARNQL